MTLRGVTKCCRRGRRTDMHPRHLVLVLILVLVLTEPVASLRGPEEDWLDPANKSDKTTHVFYSSSRNDLVARLMGMGRKQNTVLKDISHTFPTTYRPLTPLHPYLSNPLSHFTIPKPSPPPHSSLITTPHPHSFLNTSKPLVNPHPTATTFRNSNSQKTPTTANLHHLPPTAHATPDGSKTVKDHGGGAGGGNNMTTANRTRDTIAGSEQALLQAPPTLRVSLQPQHVRGEGTTQEMKKESSAGRGLSKRIIRRKAAYPRRHLLDSRRSLMPGPPYDHYRRMVHVPLGTPTTLAPHPPTLHTLPQPPTQPSLSKNSLHGRLYPKKMLPQSTPSVMSIFKKDKVPGPPRFLSPSPLPPPPPPRPIPTRPYHHRPNPRPHPPHPSTPPPSYPSSTMTPSPVFSFPPQPPSSSPPVAFTRPPHHTVPFRPPSVFSLGRRSTPRPLQPRPSVPPASPTPSPTRPPSLATTSLSSPPLSEASQGHKRRDYPVYATVPATSFTCRATPRPGLYGDVETGCQAWHVCEADGRQHSFLCPNGTVFNQRLLTCDWWYNVRCGSDDLHITTHTKRFSEGHTDPGFLYGRKMIPKLIKPHLPNREASVTSNVERVLPGPSGDTPRQWQQGQSPSPHFRGYYHGGIFPRFQL